MKEQIEFGDAATLQIVIRPLQWSCCGLYRPTASLCPAYMQKTLTGCPLTRPFAMSCHDCAVELKKRTTGKPKHITHVICIYMLTRIDLVPNLFRTARSAMGLPTSHGAGVRL